MNIFHKVTVASLKKNRVRTAVTMIGVMLSASLLTAVTTSVSSLQNFLMQNVIYQDGKWHSSALNRDSSALDALASNDEVTEIAYAQNIGYAEVDSTNEYKPYLFIMGMSENFPEMTSLHLISGNLPANTEEIILPEHLSTNGGVNYQIGDVLTLAVGERASDGDTLTQEYPCYVYDENQNAQLKHEEIIVHETKTYTVCGIYERPDFEPHSAPGYTCLTCAGNGAYSMDLYYTIRHPSKIYDFMEQTGIKGNTHTDLLMLIGVSRFEGYHAVVYGMAAILIALIMFGSVSLIYNAFAISVSERTKQFGLLSSVGATKKQLRRMVRFEALCVSAVGIPLGILLGIVGITVTFLAVGSKFSGLMSGNVPMRMHVSVLSIIVAVVISLVTILISAWIPSRRATKISAIEAIRQSNDVKAEKKPLKTPKWIYKAFGLPGMLAHKYFKRSRKKYRTTILSLFMSVVLFISSSAFTSYLAESVTGTFGDEGWDIRYYCNTGEMNGFSPQEITDLLRADANVDEVTCIFNIHANGNIPVSQLSEDLPADSAYTNFSELNDGDRVGCFGNMEFISDDIYQKLLKEYHLKESEFMNPEKPLGIAVDGATYLDPDAGKYKTIHFLSSDVSDVNFLFWKKLDGYTFYTSDDTQAFYHSDADGSELTLPKEEAKTWVFCHTGKTIYESPYYVMGSGFFTIVYPLSFMPVILNDIISTKTVNFHIKAENHTAAMTSLRKTIAEHHLANNLYDYAAERENERNLVMIVKVFSYGFIILISLIAAANVFNSISTNIALRKREFAMLKSVGMTDKNLQQMMNFECILYGVRSLLFGLPVSGIITFLIYVTVHEGFEVGFHLPWKAVGIAVCSVFTVVFSTMIYAMKKIRTEHPIEALKNENL